MRANGLYALVPAGVLDAGLASLATFTVSLYAVRSLRGPELGAYALFFAAFMLAAVLPAQLVLIPAQNAAMREAEQRARLLLLDQTWRLGAPFAVPAAVAAAGAALLIAQGSPTELRAFALSSAACACVTPLQDHVRRTLHIGGRSWSAAGVSLVQFIGVLAYLVGLGLAGVPDAWLPFGALALANLTSLTAGTLAGRRGFVEPRLPRYELSWLMRSGRWLLGMELATSGAMFLSSALISRLASQEELGLAEAARVLAQPVFVLGVGLAATLGPRLIEAGSVGNERAANQIARPFVTIIIACGLLYGAVTVWPGNPLADLVPSAYVLPLLVPMTVLAMIPVSIALCPRAELVGGGRERLLPRVAVVAGVLQCATAATALWAGAFARPIGVAVCGCIMLIGFYHYRREMYRPPSEPRHARRRRPASRQ